MPSTEIGVAVVDQSPQIIGHAPRVSEATSINFKPWVVERYSNSFRKSHAEFITIAQRQQEFWDAELKHYQDLQEKDPEAYRKLFKLSLLPKEQTEQSSPTPEPQASGNQSTPEQLTEFIEILSPEQLVINKIKDCIDAIRYREQNYTMEELASEEVLPDVLGHLSALVKIVLQDKGYTNGIRPDQMEAVIAGVTGNKKTEAQSWLEKQVTRLQDLKHWSPYSPELHNDPHGKGNVVEMQTGEGKTLVEAITAIVFTLQGKNRAVFVSSANDYLSSEGLQQMGKLYEALGMTASFIARQDGNNSLPEQYIYDLHASDYQGLSFRALQDKTDPERSVRNEAYDCDVVYGSLEEFGFDYLRDSIDATGNIRQTKGLGALVADEIHLAVTDATNPLIISSPNIRINPETGRLEVYEPDVEIEGKVYSPSQLHKKMSQIVKLLADRDLQINKSTQLVDLYDPTEEPENTTEEPLKKVSLAAHTPGDDFFIPTTGLGTPRVKKSPLEKINRTPPQLTRELITIQLNDALHASGVLRENESLETTDKFTPLQIEHLLTAMDCVGLEKATHLMKAFGLIDENAKNFYELANNDDTGVLLYYLRPALRVRSQFLREGFDYARTPDGKAKLLDATFGNDLTGRELSEGGQQAIEAYLGLPISPENTDIASITYPELLSLFEQEAGFTANATEFAQDFTDLFHLDVVQIPPHIPSLREDDLTEDIYPTREKKFEEIFEREIIPVLSADVKNPILVGIHGPQVIIEFYNFVKRRIADTNEEIKQYNNEHPDHPKPLLQPTKIQIATDINRHTAHEKFRHTGEEGYITITDLAGMGVDPKLGGERPSQWEAQQELSLMQQALNSLSVGGEKPEESNFTSKDAYETALKEWEEKHKRINDAGGLYIIGEHGVLDAQLRGRAGRNGNKGRTKFYTSQDDYFYIHGMGEGTERLEYHGEDAKYLVQLAQHHLILQDKLSREQMAKTYAPLQLYRTMFRQKRRQISDARELDKMQADPNHPVSLYDSDVGRLVHNYAGGMIANLASGYEDALKIFPAQERAKKARFVLSATIDKYCQMFGIQGDDMQLLQDYIAKADPRYILGQEPFLPSETLWAALTTFATDYYQRELRILAQKIRAQFTSHYQNREEEIDPQTLNILVKRGVIVKQAELALRLIDQNWQDYYQQQIKMNQHIYRTEPDPRKAKDRIDTSSAQAYDGFLGESYYEEVTSALFKGIRYSLG